MSLAVQRLWHCQSWYQRPLLNNWINLQRKDYCNDTKRDSSNNTKQSFSSRTKWKLEVWQDFFLSTVTRVAVVKGNFARPISILRQLPQKVEKDGRALVDPYKYVNYKCWVSIHLRLGSIFPAIVYGHSGSMVGHYGSRGEENGRNKQEGKEVRSPITDCKGERCQFIPEWTTAYKSSKNIGCVLPDKVYLSSC